MSNYYWNYSKCARSDYLFNRAQNITRYADRALSIEITSHTFTMTIMTRLSALEITTSFVLQLELRCLCCCSQKPFQPIGFPIHHSCSSLSHTTYIGEVFDAVVFFFTLSMVVVPRCAHSITLLSESVNHSSFSFMNSYKNNCSSMSIYRTYNPLWISALNTKMHGKKFRLTIRLTDKCTICFPDRPRLLYTLLFVFFFGPAFVIRQWESIK